jgi:hypothetical protein
MIKRSPQLLQRSPQLLQRSPQLRKRSPQLRKRSPFFQKQRSPFFQKQRSPFFQKQRSPFFQKQRSLRRRKQRSPFFQKQRCSPSFNLRNKQLRKKQLRKKQLRKKQLKKICSPLLRKQRRSQKREMKGIYKLLKQNKKDISELKSKKYSVSPPVVPPVVSPKRRTCVDYKKREECDKLSYCSWDEKYGCLHPSQITLKPDVIGKLCSYDNRDSCDSDKRCYWDGNKCDYKILQQKKFQPTQRQTKGRKLCSYDDKDSCDSDKLCYWNKDKCSFSLEKQLSFPKCDKDSYWDGEKCVKKQISNELRKIRMEQTKGRKMCSYDDKDSCDSDVKCYWDDDRCKFELGRQLILKTIPKAPPAPPVSVQKKKILGRMCSYDDKDSCDSDERCYWDDDRCKFELERQLILKNPSTQSVPVPSVPTTRPRIKISTPEQIEIQRIKEEKRLRKEKILREEEEEDILTKEEEDKQRKEIQKKLYEQMGYTEEQLKSMGII